MAAPRHLIHRQTTKAQREVRIKTGQARRCQAKHRGNGVRARQRNQIPLEIAAPQRVWKAGSNKAAPEGPKDPHGPHLDGDANKNPRTSRLQAPRRCPGAINQDMSSWGAGREEACSQKAHQPAGLPARR